MFFSLNLRKPLSMLFGVRIKLNVQINWPLLSCFIVDLSDSDLYLLCSRLFKGKWFRESQPSTNVIHCSYSFCMYPCVNLANHIWITLKARNLVSIVFGKSVIWKNIWWFKFRRWPTNETGLKAWLMNITYRYIHTCAATKTLTSL